MAANAFKLNHETIHPKTDGVLKEGDLDIFF